MGKTPPGAVRVLGRPRTPRAQERLRQRMATTHLKGALVRTGHGMQHCGCRVWTHSQVRSGPSTAPLCCSCTPSAFVGPQAVWSGCMEIGQSHRCAAYSHSVSILSPGDLVCSPAGGHQCCSCMHQAWQRFTRLQEEGPRCHAPWQRHPNAAAHDRDATSLHSCTLQLQSPHANNLFRAGAACRLQQRPTPTVPHILHATPSMIDLSGCCKPGSCPIARGCNAESSSCHYLAHTTRLCRWRGHGQQQRRR
jgi:hypothetical protein